MSQLLHITAVVRSTAYMCFRFDLQVLGCWQLPEFAAAVTRNMPTVSLLNLLPTDLGQNQVVNTNICHVQFCHATLC